LGSETLCFNTTNGLAAGPTIASAVLGGLYELVERDALMIMWLNRLPVPEADLRDIGGFPQLYLAHYAQRGIEIRVFNLTTDIPAHVMMAIAVDRSGNGPAAVIGLGCSLDPNHAIVKALLELYQSQVGQAWRFHQRPSDARVLTREDVRDFPDHAALFANQELLPELNFFLGAARLQPVHDLRSASTGSVDGDLEAMVGMLEQAGSRVAYVDLTTPDVAPLGIRVVRALATDLQPIHSGHRQERLGGRRLYDVPRRLGYLSSEAQEDYLNPCPHPLP
jgi:ribosomal protein S12 methylthiotransferase accessory factor